MRPRAADDIAEHRAHLFAVAYRMLGSAAEAEDVLQEAFVRWAEHEGGVDSPRAFLTTIVVRLCLDHLKSARARREAYVGPWLPEPIVARAHLDVAAERPDARQELAESLSLAFLALLERLTPLERAAFLLREVFDQSYDEVAAVLGTSEAACRQLVVRARAHIEANRPRFRASDEKKRELLQAFVAACSAGDAARLGVILAEDVVARTDGGGRVAAALKPVFGRDRVVRFMFGVLKKAPRWAEPVLTDVNGEPGLVLRVADGTTFGVVTLGVANDLITDVLVVLNPEKLSHAALGSVTDG